MTQEPTTRAPEAVLFDFGGGIFDCWQDDGGYDALAEHVADLLRRSGTSGIPLAEIAQAIRGAARRYSDWKREMSDETHPRETTPEEYWSWVSSGWPSSARATLKADAPELSRRLERLTILRLPKPGIREVLMLLRDREVRTAVVSNALAGHASRELMREHDLDGLVGPQLYSNELGIRKPNPDLALHACEALGVEPARAWMVGDSPDRDMRCANRAGVGCVVLIPAGPLPELVGEDRPHVIAESAQELLLLLEKAMG